MSRQRCVPEFAQQTQDGRNAAKIDVTLFAARGEAEEKKGLGPVSDVVFNLMDVKIGATKWLKRHLPITDYSICRN